MLHRTASGSVFVVIGCGLFLKPLLGQLNPGQGPGTSAASCPSCENNPVMPGHGPASSIDNRRIISIKIDSSWNSSPGNTNANIWNGVACAVKAWNTATDANGNLTAYYFKVDQGGQYGPTADITIVNGAVNAGPGASGFAVTAAVNNSGPPYVTTLSPANATQAAGDLCGRIAHEFGHAIGLDHSTDPNCSQTIMNGADPNTGVRPVNSVQQADVSEVNLEFSNPGGCPNTAVGSGETALPSSCPGDPPNVACVCDLSSGQWNCSQCAGDPPNESCSCEGGSWQCDCQGTGYTCDDGTAAVCYNGGWTCGTVTTSQCIGDPPDCGDGSVAQCVSDTWQCVGAGGSCTDVCDPSCPNYDPSQCGDTTDSGTTDSGTTDSGTTDSGSSDGSGDIGCGSSDDSSDDFAEVYMKPTATAVPLAIGALLLVPVAFRVRRNKKKEPKGDE